MFGMVILAVLFFLVAGPLSLIITIPMIIFATIGNTRRNHADSDAQPSFRARQEWKIERDPIKGGHRYSSKRLNDAKAHLALLLFYPAPASKSGVKIPWCFFPLETFNDHVRHSTT